MVDEDRNRKQDHAGIDDRGAEIRIVERAQIVARADEFARAGGGRAGQRNAEAPEQRNDAEHQDQQDRRQHEQQRHAGLGAAALDSCGGGCAELWLVWGSDVAVMGGSLREKDGERTKRPPVWERLTSAAWPAPGPCPGPRPRASTVMSPLSSAWLWRCHSSSSAADALAWVVGTARVASQPMICFRPGLSMPDVSTGRVGRNDAGVVDEDRQHFGRQQRLDRIERQIDVLRSPCSRRSRRRHRAGRPGRLRAGRPQRSARASDRRRHCRRPCPSRTPSSARRWRAGPRRWPQCPARTG